MKTGMQRLVEAAATEGKVGTTVLAEFFGVTLQAAWKFVTQGYLPLPRARAASERFGIPIRDLVRPDIRAAMDATENPANAKPLS